MRMLCNALGVEDDTLSIAVNYFDSILKSYTVQQADLSLLGFTCICLSSKKFDNQLTVTERLLAAGSNYTPHQLRDMELRVQTILAIPMCKHCGFCLVGKQRAGGERHFCRAKKKTARVPFPVCAAAA